MSQSLLRKRAGSIRARLGVTEAAGRAADSGAMSLCDEIQYGLIWSRGALSLEDRLIVALTVCCQRSLHGQLETLAAAALDNGLTRRSVAEVCLQTGIYAGFALSESALERLGSDFALGEEEAAGGREDPMRISERGARMRERLHGKRHEDGYADPGHPFASPLYEIANDHCYGLIWNRPGLSLRQRLVCALAALSGTAAGRDTFLKFVQSALSNGVSLTEVVEIVMQTVPYAGFPGALAILAALGETYPDFDPGGGFQSPVP